MGGLAKLARAGHQSEFLAVEGLTLGALDVSEAAVARSLLREVER